MGYGALRSVRTLQQPDYGEVVRVCVTGATGYIGAHVAKLAADSFDELRVTYRSEWHLADLDAEPVKADVTDRASLRRAFKGCEVVFHTAGLVASRPVARVWEVNALGPRLVVEAAAAEGVRRVVSREVKLHFHRVVARK